LFKETQRNQQIYTLIFEPIDEKQAPQVAKKNTLLIVLDNQSSTFEDELDAKKLHPLTYSEKTFSFESPFQSENNETDSFSYVQLSWPLDAATEFSAQILELGSFSGKMKVSFNALKNEVSNASTMIELTDLITDSTIILGNSHYYEFNAIETPLLKSSASQSLLAASSDQVRFKVRFSHVVTPIEEKVLKATQVELFQNYPNPFNPSTLIRFELPFSMNVKVTVFSISGQEVAVLTQGLHSAGVHERNFLAQQFASGLYLYRLETPHGSVTKKMLLLK
jgi:hypothetical protein